MAARRASVQFLGILQRSSVRSFQPVAAPRQAAVATFSQGRDVNEHVARSTYGGFFGNRQLHKESQAKNDNEETHQYEKTKMTDEGGGSVESDYGVKAAEVSQRGEKAAEEAKNKAQEVKDKASEATDQAKGKASELASEGSEKVNQATDTVKEKASEVADEGKGQVSKNVDTAKDMFKDLPQKVSETATGLKEVGVEAGKAIKRDASKVAQKVGVKTDGD